MIAVLARTLLLLCAACSVSAARAEPPDPALALVVNCFTCHGTDGMSPGAMPSLNGKTSDYLLEKLRGFQDDSEENTIMGRIARGYSDPEIEAIAQFLGKPE